MRSIILFSTYVPAPDRIPDGLEWLRLLERTFPHSRILIGDNAESCGEWGAELSWTDHPYRKTTEELNVNSDAAGYLECLRMLKEVGKRYDVVWFAHTKGLSREPRYVEGFLRLFRESLFRRAEEIESMFKTDSDLGLVCNYLMIDRKPNPRTDLLRTYYPFKCRQVGHFAAHTFYAMRGSVVHEFIEKCDQRIFKENLISQGFDRWFFEADFPAVAEMMGYQPRALDCVFGEHDVAHERQMGKWRKDPVNHVPEAFPW